MAVIVAVRPTVQRPWASIELAHVTTGFRRAISDADWIPNRRPRGPIVAADALRHRVRQRFGGGVGRSRRRVTGTGRRRRRNRRNLLERLRWIENGSDLQRMSQFRRGTVVFLDYVCQIFVSGDRDQGL